MSPSLRQRIHSSPRYPSWVLFACLAGMSAASFTITILGVSLSPIAADLGSTPEVARALYDKTVDVLDRETAP